MFFLLSSRRSGQVVRRRSRKAKIACSTHVCAWKFSKVQNSRNWKNWHPLNVKQLLSAVISPENISSAIYFHYWDYWKFSKFEGSRVDSNLRPQPALDTGPPIKLVACTSNSLISLITSKRTSQLVLLSSDLALMDRWNVHQRVDRVFAETIDSSFTLREKHSNSSSKLSCVSLLKHKDGTRTIEMILKSTVLGLEKFLKSFFNERTVIVRVCIGDFVIFANLIVEFWKCTWNRVQHFSVQALALGYRNFNPDIMLAQN